MKSGLAFAAAQDSPTGTFSRCLATYQAALTVITSNIVPILIVTGALTATMLVQFVAPSWTVYHTYGVAPSGTANIVLARHWGLLLFCVGALLVYAAFRPEIRGPAVLLALVEKAGFVACIFGTSLRQRLITSLMAAGDAVMVLLYVLYFAGD